jgi:hypothetical protein
MLNRHTASKDKSRRGTQELKDARRRERCEQNLSLQLKGGAKVAPGARGACEKESSSQGSE